MIKHDINKPNTPFQQIVDHFEQQRKLEIAHNHVLLPEEVCIIGDRLVGDILWGSSLGFLTIKTEPLTSQGENFVVRMVWSRHCSLLFY